MPRRTLTPRQSIAQDARRISQALDTDDVDVEDQEGIDPQDSPGSISWSTGHFERMYQPQNFNPSIGPKRDPDTIWHPSLIHDQMVDGKAKVKNARGARIWYRESELPNGARIFDAADGATLKCPVEACGGATGNGPKMLHTWRQMQAHMEAAHSVEYLPWKKKIEEKVADEADATLDRIMVGAKIKDDDSGE